MRFTEFLQEAGDKSEDSSFYDYAYGMAKGKSAEEQRIGSFLTIFLKNFRYGFYDLALKVAAAPGVKSHIPPAMLKKCEDNKNKITQMPWGNNIG